MQQFDISLRLFVSKFSFGFLRSDNDAKPLGRTKRLCETE